MLGKGTLSAKERERERERMTERESGITNTLLKSLHNLALTGVAQWIKCRPAHWFDSQSGHVPGLQARSPVEGA